jgi:hypothetical protein
MKAMNVGWMMVSLAVLAAGGSTAQSKIDDARMDRDIEVAESALGTLLRQQFQKRYMFPMEVEGRYTAGFGVTFRLPGDFFGPMAFSVAPGHPDDVVIWDGDGRNSFSYSITADDDDDDDEDDDNDPIIVNKGRNRVTVKSKSVNRDSARQAYNTKLVAASKEFLADYADLIGQLQPDEHILITNRGEQERMWVWGAAAPRRTYLSVDATRSDVTQYKQGKLTRDQFMARVRVVNTESTEELSPDLELLTSLFNRLYRRDLSKTYFTEENVYYERMKDFGAIYYMEVYSSNVEEGRRYSMPTVKLDNLSQEERDKKVMELYPRFEADLKDNIIEYGRTLKSLKDEEVLIFNVKVTKCTGCGIPSNLELTVKAQVLKDYHAGKLDKAAAVSRINVKKGPAQ